jgi:hypothetical protein
MTTNFETRLANVVWLVLAGVACRPADSATSSGPAPSATTVDLPTPTSTATAVPVTPTASATSTADATVAVTPGKLPDARAVCAQYQAKASSDPNGPRTQTPPPMQRTSIPASRDDIQARRLDDTKVECRIVWERTTTTETVMVTPVCCPQGHTIGPCPPASPQQFPGERSKLEVAIVTNDATRISGTLAFNQFVAEPPRHMCGRRPEGFAAGAAQHDARDVGACLAEMAELEAASIAAFDRLARELAAHGAPAALVARARAARRDEIRHAKTVRALARRFGAEPRATRARKLPVRSPLAIAIENAVEGCVFETLGAAVATFQAARAEDAAVRAAFARVAEDERRHAALAWAVDAWLATLCSAEERDAIERARRDARAELRASTASEDDATRRALGLPSPSERDALVRGVSALAA